MRSMKKELQAPLAAVRQSTKNHFDLLQAGFLSRHQIDVPRDIEQT